MSGKGTQDSDVRSLITRISGFEREDENFDLCLQFTVNHFKYHRFLSVDSSKITRRLDGIATKFAVHSQKDKSDKLKTLINEFLHLPLTSKSQQPKTDGHYGILSLLLDLSDCPTERVFKEKQQVPEGPKVAEFDWSSYLLEGEDRRRYHYSDTSDDEEESEEETDHSQTETVVDIADVEPSDALCTHDKVKDWLERNLVVQYWNGKGNEQASIGRFPSSNLHINWDKFQSSVNPFHVSRKNFITESQLAREILWMLLGVTETYVFNFDGRRFSINKDVYLSHLTDTCLDSNLQKFIRFGDQIVALNSFCEDVIKQTCDLQDLTLVTQSYQAFVGTLTQFLRDYQQRLSQEEIKVRNQAVPMTLSVLHEDLDQWFDKMDLVYSIYITGIAAAAELDSNILKASHLLNVMFKMLIDHDTLGSPDKDKLRLLLIMWVQTCEPYLTILSDWINTGNLEDPREDFLIQRNKSVQSFDETFWESAFDLRLKSNVDMSSSKVSQDIDISDATTIPKFLQPVLKEVVLTGKSMELLMTMGKAENVLRMSGSGFEQKSLYKIFINNLAKMMGTTKPTSTTEELMSRPSTPAQRTTSESDGVSSRATTSRSNTSSWQLEKHLKVKGVVDPFLQINFEEIMNSVKMSDSSHHEKEEDDLSLLEKLDLDSLQPLEIILQKCLYPYIQERYTEVCQELVVIVKNQHNLLHHLKDMRSFFLMEAGDTLFDFYSNLFDRMKRHEEWRDESVLSFILQDALESQFSHSTHRLAVEIRPPSENDQYPISLTDCIKLRYQVPWPASMIISQKYQTRYNEIFSFLLQIKRAEYSLDQLNFKDLEKKNILKALSLSQVEDLPNSDSELPAPVKIHRMQIFRFRLLYFVNSLNHYIMTRILSSTGMEFERNLKEASDLDQIIAAHINYLHKIYHRCLLDASLISLKSAITKVLNLVLVFQNYWEEGVDEISKSALEEMEITFSRCVQFLASFLNSLIKRGSFPHLEFVAFAMKSLTDTMDKL